MPQVKTLPVTFPLQAIQHVSTSIGTRSIPGAVWLALLGIASTMVGATWDLAWHMSIGRDVFFTPPHILIGLGGILPGIACVYTILATTLTGSSRAGSASIRVLGLDGPGGAFLTLWGSVAMVASAPFDNWWHNAYGLDLQFATPPHALLSLGYFAIRIGAILWVACKIDSASPTLRKRRSWLILIVGATCVMIPPVPVLAFTSRSYMHTATCYLAIAAFTPLMVIATKGASAHRWGCTIVTSIYMGLGVASEWLIPLFPAEPKLGPVYHNVTHLIPLQFPLLLIVPGLTADLLLQRLEPRSSWTKALCVGPSFVLSMIAVQWPFANYLMSPPSRTWIFGTAYFAYSDPAGILSPAYRFKTIESSPTVFALTLVAAFAVAILSTRLGVGWGDWMARVRR